MNKARHASNLCGKGCGINGVVVKPNDNGLILNEAIKGENVPNFIRDAFNVYYFVFVWCMQE